MPLLFFRVSGPLIYKLTGLQRRSMTCPSGSCSFVKYYPLITWASLPPHTPDASVLPPGLSIDVANVTDHRHLQDDDDGHSESGDVQETHSLDDSGANTVRRAGDGLFRDNIGPGCIVLGVMSSRRSEWERPVRSDESVLPQGARLRPDDPSELWLSIKPVTTGQRVRSVSVEPAVGVCSSASTPWWRDSVPTPPGSPPPVSTFSAASLLLLCFCLCHRDWLPASGWQRKAQLQSLTLQKAHGQRGWRKKGKADHSARILTRWHVWRGRSD